MENSMAVPQNINSRIIGNSVSGYVYTQKN